MRRWIGLIMMAGAGHALPALAGPTPLAQIAASAQQAQTRCQEFMHDNADEYVSCLNALGAAVKGKTVAAQAEKLGIAYFGWLGATHAARVSLPGSDDAALHFYLRFTPLQQQLKISDLDLCGTFAGDCKVRLAQLDEIRKVVAVQKARASAQAKASASAKAAK
ncbi:MAG: hypothetical protein RL748_278 [Pseudomonadota bacterium]